MSLERSRDWEVADRLQGSRHSTIADLEKQVVVDYCLANLDRLEKRIGLSSWSDRKVLVEKSHCKDLHENDHGELLRTKNLHKRFVELHHKHLIEARFATKIAVPARYNRIFERIPGDLGRPSDQMRVVHSTPLGSVKLAAQWSVFGG